MADRAGVNAQALRALRKRLGWSVREVAERLGVHRSTVHRWERGEAKPQGLTLAAVRRWLGRQAP